MSETVDLWVVQYGNYEPPEVAGIYPTHDAAEAACKSTATDDVGWQVVRWTVELPPAAAEVLRRARDWRALYDPGVPPDAYYGPAERALVAAVDAAYPSGGQI